MGAALSPSPLEEETEFINPAAGRASERAGVVGKHFAPSPLCCGVVAFPRAVMGEAEGGSYVEAGAGGGSPLVI